MKEMDEIGEKMEEKSEDGIEEVTNLKGEPRGRNNFLELYIELSTVLSVRALTDFLKLQATGIVLQNPITKFSPLKRDTTH